ncbi:uncharacterized protein LOC125231937 [Leguminivora glycinivorella]|uniref:uncharacterized protein LOC125231937 n=1 Tax=Leguminivora glycinivorella TaxID=1035111 RepID=UPI00200D592D|nr:uncharacterized protein LOC125231937 [Leguminivora glycinivorella]
MTQEANEQTDRLMVITGGRAIIAGVIRWSACSDGVELGVVRRGAALALALLALVARRKDPAPLFGVYTRPGKWYYLKYVVFAAIYYFRKYAIRFRGAGGRAGQGVRAISDPALMDRAQPLSDDAKAFDAVFFIAADGAGAPEQEGTYVMMGCERRPLGMCNGLFYLGLPGKGLLCSSKLPDTVLFGARSGEFGAEGIRIAPAEPMRRWTLHYQGKMRYQRDPTVEVEVTFTGEWTANSRHFDFDCELHAPAVIRSIAREPWTRQYFDGLKKAHQSHYEQFGTLRCSATLGGETLQFSLPSFRDHSYGARRDWALMRRYAFHHIFLADGSSASVGVVCQPSTATHFELGVVRLADGRVAAARGVGLQLWQHGEAGTPPRDYGFSFRAGDQDYYVQVQVEHEATHYVSAEWEARMQERFCRYAVNGVPGRGTCEFHYHHAGGRPAAASDPEWYRRMSHAI